MNCERLPLSNLTISIVSHGQGYLVKDLLSDLQQPMRMGAQVILTLNLQEDEDYINTNELRPTIIRNQVRRGFGENHNNAYELCNRQWFLVLNPDIRLDQDVLNDVVSEAGKYCATNKPGVFAPIIENSAGDVEDSARKFPTVARIIIRIASRIMRIKLLKDYDVETANLTSVDWISGCFMLFDSSSFAYVGGFDAKYYMYMEDSDICRRLHKNGFSVILLGNKSVTHDARRASRRNLNHFYWHLRSLMRFILKP